MSFTPIETHYRGYRFRSRLEARWAVFFDALGVSWDYEREGFDLGPVGWYLPDFWVASWDRFVEIKGEPATDTERERCARLALASGSPVLLIVGAPWPNVYDAYVFGEGYGEEDAAQFGQCRRCDAIWLTAGDTWGMRLGAGDADCRGCSDKYPVTGTDRPLLKAAYEAARGARFEHGEAGD